MLLIGESLAVNVKLSHSLKSESKPDQVTQVTKIFEASHYLGGQKPNSSFLLLDDYMLRSHISTKSGSGRNLHYKTTTRHLKRNKKKLRLSKNCF